MTSMYFVSQINVDTNWTKNIAFLAEAKVKNSKVLGHAKVQTIALTFNDITSSDLRS